MNKIYRCTECSKELDSCYCGMLEEMTTRQMAERYMKIDLLLTGQYCFIKRGEKIYRAKPENIIVEIENCEVIE